MNDSCRSPLRIGAVCAAAIAGVMLATCMAQTSRTLMEFHGVTPGESRIDSLRAGEWNQLVSQSTAADGTRHLEFHIAPWKKVVVVAKGDRVVGIDLFPPRGLTGQKACDAFGLGRVMIADQLPPEARFATEGIAGTLYESEATFVLIEMEDQDGLQGVRRLRFFGNRPLPAGGTAEGGRPVPAMQPDLSGRPPAAVAPFTAQQARAYQETWARQLGLPVELTNSIGMRLRLIPPGQLTMGSPDSEEDRGRDEGPQHRVRITRPFHLGVHEVTQGQWFAVMETRPWIGSDFERNGSEYPATHVSWEDAVQFCLKLSAREAREYRLPTEAEWEYACRAGTATAYHFGDAVSQLGHYAWWGGALELGSCGNQRYAHPVGQKKSNAFGLFDVHGNVSEWCADWYGDDYYVNSPSDDPAGPQSGSARVVRGGDWYCSARVARSAHRVGHPRDFRVHGNGFRVAFSPAAATGK